MRRTIGIMRSTMIGRQAHRHLVDQQHLGLRRERPGHGQHLLLAARQQAGAPACAAAASAGNISMALSMAAARPGAVAGEAEPEVLGDREVEEQRPVLGHVGEPATGHLVRLVRRAPARRAPSTEPVDRAQDARDREQRRGLAGTVRAEQRDDLAGAKSRLRPRTTGTPP